MNLLFLFQGLNPLGDAKPPSRRSSTGTRRFPHNGGDFPPSNGGHSHHHPLVVDSYSPVATAMPPPRETKTLASVREKLRAKRLMMGGQHGNNQAPTSSPAVTQNNHVATPTQILAPPPPPPPPPLPSPQFPPAVPVPLPSGSLTPNPGASSSGNIYSRPATSQAPTQIHPPTAATTAPPPVTIPPIGGSISAPPTPQHGSVHGGAANGGPLPAILANFKQARVVVAPSRSVSGSSVSSGDDNDHAHPQGSLLVTDSNQNAQSTAAEPVTVQANVSTGGTTAATSANAANGTTTRAFFVDGNNLTETLALLQSINPRATVTQQQFFLIPSVDKSHAILWRTPIAIQPKQTGVTPQTQQPQQSVQPSIPQPATAVQSQPQQVLRRIAPPPTAPQLGQQPMVPVVSQPTGGLPLILPANSRLPQQETTGGIPHGMYREILPQPRQSVNAAVTAATTSAASRPIQPHPAFFGNQQPTAQPPLPPPAQQQQQVPTAGPTVVPTFLPPPAPPSSS